jgi:hypothetical protein
MNSDGNGTLEDDEFGLGLTVKKKLSARGCRAVTADEVLKARGALGADSGS